jgi:DNA invertase Pin-like site-specific DNA recombinase
MIGRIGYKFDRAFAYLRMSGKGQLGGDGFPRQRATIKEFAESRDIRIGRWFREEGISGKRDLENRPALQEMMLALHSNGTRVVLIEKLDRLARDLMFRKRSSANCGRMASSLSAWRSRICAAMIQAANRFVKCSELLPSTNAR